MHNPLCTRQSIVQRDYNIPPIPDEIKIPERRIGFSMLFNHSFLSCKEGGNYFPTRRNSYDEIDFRTMKLLDTFLFFFFRNLLCREGEILNIKFGK